MYLPAQEPLVSIIILNWNNLNYTIDFLQSTRVLNYKNYEILVCDMNSDQDPTNEINQLGIPNTRVLKSDKNLGWGPGNNWGMRQAKGEFFFVVNNDTELTPNLINLLVEPFFNPNYSGENQIGVTCPKIKYFDKRELIQYAGFTKINPVTGRNHAIGNHETDNGQYDKEYFTYSAHGCAMMIRKELVDKIGMFPEKFFIYYDEMDFSARVLKSGYHILFQGNATIFHKESVTMGKNSSKKTYFLTRNRILYMRRNSNPLYFAGFFLFFTFLSVPKTILGYLKEKKHEHLQSFLKGIAWNFKNSKYSIT